MSRRPYGTRWTTGCGHSWRNRHNGWRVIILTGATMDCPHVDKVTKERCNELLIIPREQFAGMELFTIPVEVHAPLFHKYLNQQDPSWPADGAGTGYVEFDVE